MGTIRTRVATLALLPILGLLTVVTLSLVDGFQRSHELSNLRALASLGAGASAVAHELQKERGATAVYLGSHGQQFGGETHDQRWETDRRLAEFEQALGVASAKQMPPGMLEALKEAKARLAGLGDARQAITRREMTTAGSFGYYSETIDGLVRIIVSLAQATSNAEVSNIITAYRKFVQAKEMAGRERATGSGIFSGGRFDPETYRLYVAEVALQEAYLQEFRSYAPADLVAEFDRAMLDFVVSDVMAMRQVILDLSDATGLAGADAPRWFERTTARIDLMKRTEDRLAQAMVNLAQEKEHGALRSFLVLAAAMAALVSATIVFSLLLIRSISGALEGLAKSAFRMAEGEADVDLPGVDRDDEVGDVARALQVLRDARRELEEVK